MFEEAGLPFERDIERMPNSRRALMLSDLARERGALDELYPRLFRAYWAEGQDTGDESVLLEHAAAAGLDETEARAAMSDERRLAAVDRETRAALELGVTGVPAWLVDKRLLIPGAQPHELFARVLGKLGYEPAGWSGAP